METSAVAKSHMVGAAAMQVLETAEVLVRREHLVLVQRTRLRLMALGDPPVDLGQVGTRLRDSELDLDVVRFQVAGAVDAWLDELGDLLTEEEPFDAMVLSSSLGGVAGRNTPALLHRIRALSAMGDVCMYVCEPSYSAAYARSLYAAGASAYLCGAVATTLLASSLARLVGRRGR